MRSRKYCGCGCGEIGGSENDVGDGSALLGAGESGVGDMRVYELVVFFRYSAITAPRSAVFLLA